MSHCIDCGVRLTSDNRVSDGRNLCKPCKNERQEIGRRRLAQTLKEIQQAEKLEREALALTPPRTFNYGNQPYVPERGYYRNDGHKHILSRGF